MPTTKITNKKPRKRSTPRKKPAQSPPQVVDAEPVPPNKINITCSLCGHQAGGEDPTKVAGWAAQHFRDTHPDEWNRLHTISCLFLMMTLLDAYESDYNWREEEPLATSVVELLEIIDGTRDALADFIS